MSDHFQLSRYETQDAGNNNILVLVSGNWVYYRILTDAFQEYRFSRGFEDRRVRYDWGTYIYNIGPEDRNRVQKLLDLFTGVVCIQDSLNQSFALSYHMQYVGGQLVRTEIGELVYNAKPYNRSPTPQNKERATTLADHLAQFINLSSFLRALRPDRPCAAFQFQ